MIATTTALIGYETSLLAQTIPSFEKAKEAFGGTVYQRKDKRWVSRYKSKKAIEPYLQYSKTEEEANQKLIKFWENDLLGIRPALKTFAQVYEDWLYSFKIYTVAQPSFDTFEKTYINHVKKEIGAFQFQQVSPPIIQRLLQKKALKYSHSIMKKIQTNLTQFYDYASAEKLIEKNPMTLVKKPSKKSIAKKKEEIFFLEDNEVARVERVIENEVKKARKTGDWNAIATYGYLIIFMMNTGLRRGEVLALTYDDINLKKKEVDISKSLAYVKIREVTKYSMLQGWNYLPPKGNNRGKKKPANTWIFTSPKSEKGIRKVPMNKKACTAIKELRKIQKSLGFADEKFLARTKDGFPIYQSGWKNTLKTIMEKANVKKPISPHELRHTFATRSYARGIEIGLISEWLGHEDVSTTIDTYVHLVKRHKKAGKELLEKL